MSIRAALRCARRVTRAFLEPFSRFHLRYPDTYELSRGAARLIRPAAPLRASDVLVGLVAENDVNFLSQAERFLHALRRFGGALSAARVRVCVVGGVAQAARERLEAEGAQVRVVERFHPTNPFGNKLQFFETLRPGEARVFLLVDCDTLVAGDPLPHLDPECVQVKIADLPTVQHQDLSRGFEHYGMRPPLRAFATEFHRVPTIPYFNSGVVAVPNRLVPRLVPTWREINLELTQRPEVLGRGHVHANQASLAIAIARERVPVRLFDTALNFPLRLDPSEPGGGLAGCDPVILHYHDLVDAEGLLLPSRHAGAQRQIEAFNESWREAHRRERTTRPAPNLVLTGIPRSGTSYLCSLLHRYDDCVAVNEPGEVVASLSREAVPWGVRDFFVETRRKVRRGERIANRLDEQGAVTSDTAVANGEIATSYLPRPRTDGFVLAVKNTRAFLSRLAQVREVMSGAPVIACVRNPWDTLGSWKRSFAHLRDAALEDVPVGHPDDPRIPAEDRARLREIAAIRNLPRRRALWWRHFADILLRERDAIRIVRYVDLVTNPGPTLEAALGGWPVGRVEKRLDSSSPRRSRAELDEEDEAAIETLCVDAARALGVGAPD